MKISILISAIFASIASYSVQNSFAVSFDQLGTPTLEPTIKVSPAPLPVPPTVPVTAHPVHATASNMRELPQWRGQGGGGSEFSARITPWAAAPVLVIWSLS